MLDLLLLKRVGADLDRWEATVSWMYLDSEGLVTVGCGTMLPTAGSASGIPFFHDANSRNATPLEIEKAWNKLASGHLAQKVTASKQKHSYKFYEDKTDLRITKATADGLRDSHLNADYIQLLLIFPKFDGFPDDAKVALFDMIYNLGPGHGKKRHHRATGLRAYAKMNAAIEKGDWATASASCARHGIPAARNKMTATLFANCVKPEPVGRLP